MKDELYGSMLKYSFLLLITHESAEYREASITTFRCQGC
jgi:hypothetical protein